IIQKAYKALDRFHWSPEALLSYEESEKRINDYLSSLGQKFIEGKAEGLSEGIEKGMQKGLSEGIEKGMQKGLAEGIQKGKEEGVRKNQIETVKSMLQEKLSLSVVVKITGLTLEEVQGIEASIKKPLQHPCGQ
ncbi:MAG: hypothetical protein NTZ52_01840, partial [Chlamydiae bacterium]|nr:hypothetical protein [Chlamydiota bacterium]